MASKIYKTNAGGKHSIHFNKDSDGYTIEDRYTMGPNKSQAHAMTLKKSAFKKLFVMMKKQIESEK